MLTNVEKCWQRSTGIDKYWKVLTSFDKYWQVVTGVGKYRLININRCWQDLTNINWWWQMLIDTNKHWLALTGRCCLMLTGVDYFWLVQTGVTRGTRCYASEQVRPGGVEAADDHAFTPASLSSSRPDSCPPSDGGDEGLRVLWGRQCVVRENRNGGGVEVGEELLLLPFYSFF